VPAQALVGVTYRCDSRCSHCAIWTDYLKQPELASQEMTLAEFEQFLDRNPQLAQVATTGGEQFCRDDIADFWLAMDRRATALVAPPTPSRRSASSSARRSCSRAFPDVTCATSVFRLTAPSQSTTASAA
jgi:uncharacterized radical SAM superfamily Fe-S cluster-containing enzyme